MSLEGEQTTQGSDSEGQVYTSGQNHVCIYKISSENAKKANLRTYIELFNSKEVTVLVCAALHSRGKHGGGNVRRFCRGFNGDTRFIIGQIFVKSTDMTNSIYL